MLRLTNSHNIMELLRLLTLLFICCSSSIVEQVLVSSVSTSSNQVVLSKDSTKSFIISSIQEEIAIQVTVCPPKTASKYLFDCLMNSVLLQCNIQDFDGNSQKLTHTIHSSDCQSISLGFFQNGQAYWTPTQGLYTLAISISDSQLLESSSYSLAITNPTSLQLQTNKILSESATMEKSIIQQTGIEVTFPSTLHPFSIRWYVDLKAVDTSEFILVSFFM